MLVIASTTFAQLTMQDLANQAVRLDFDSETMVINSEKFSDLAIIYKNLNPSVDDSTKHMDYWKLFAKSIISFQGNFKTITVEYGEGRCFERCRKHKEKMVRLLTEELNGQMRIDTYAEILATAITTPYDEY